MNNNVRTPELALRLEATGWPIAELWTRLRSASDLAQAHLRRASKPLDDTPASLARRKCVAATMQTALSCRHLKYGILSDPECRLLRRSPQDSGRRPQFARSSRAARGHPRHHGLRCFAGML